MRKGMNQDEDKKSQEEYRDAPNMPIVPENHYIPDISEFGMGFEYQIWNDTYEGDKNGERLIPGTTWINRTIGMGVWDLKGQVKRLLDKGHVCAKYLDAKDIESQDFVIQQSTWDRESLKRTVIKYVPHPKFDSGAQFEKVINETLVWQIFWNAETGDMIIVKAHNERKRRLMWSEPKDKKEKPPTTYFMEFDERFKGVIKNKSEFKRILQQTGVVKTEV